MSNTIELAKSFVPKLDECYRLASLTSVLDGAPELAKQGANANELIIPMMSMDGLADYSRNGGYVQGGVTMTNETVKCNFDRGRRFDVDVMDDLETAGLAFGRLSAQFIRDKVVPELDAFRFASYCGISGVTKKEETLADGAATVAALSAAVTAMDDEEVTATGRYLFITPTLLQGINDMDTTKSKKVLEGFEQVIKVPQRRFYTAIKQLSGKTGEEAGGYTKAAGRGQHQLRHRPEGCAHPVYEARRAEDHRPGKQPGRGCLRLRLSHGGHRQGIQEYAVWHVLQPRQGVRRIYYGYYRIHPARRRADPRGQRAACAGQCSACRGGGGTAVPRSDGHGGRRKACQAHEEGSGQGVKP